MLLKSKKYNRVGLFLLFHVILHCVVSFITNVFACQNFYYEIMKIHSYCYVRLHMSKRKEVILKKNIRSVWFGVYQKLVIKIPKCSTPIRIQLCILNQLIKTFYSRHKYTEHRIRPAP